MKIIWNKVTKFSQTIAIILFVGVFFLGFFIAYSFYWVNYLRVAHSSFDNYYNFRGCEKLVEKTDTYGTCEISNGTTIKIVKYQNKWFLDGDLP